MEQEVLITYGSRSESMKEVAEAIGATMEEAGVTVAARPMADVESIPDDASLVIGTAWQGGRFPREFQRFLKRLQGELGDLHPWIFILVQDGKLFAAAEEQARQELAKYPWLHAADVRVMGSNVDPQGLRRLFPFLRKAQSSDSRDWEFIRRWANAIAEHMQKVPTEQRGEFAEYSSYRKSLLGS